MREADHPDSYRVHLDVFDGPFDLLLQLIARRELEPYEVDLAEITADFLAHLRVELTDGRGDQPPGPSGSSTAQSRTSGAASDSVAAQSLDTTTHFLVVAATLIELKAARLLPEPEREQLEDLLAEVRDVLYARLLEYKAFRDAGDVIEQRLQENAGHVPRDVPLDDRFAEMMPATDLDADLDDLGALAAAASAPREPETVSVAHIHQATVTVREAAQWVLDRLSAPGERAVFKQLVRGLPRAGRVAHFLALLELYKLGRVGLDQPERFGDVHVRRLAGGDELDAIEEPGG